LWRTKAFAITGAPPAKPNFQKETTMFKKSRIEIQNLHPNKQRIGQREVTEATLKMVSGGMACQGGTCTACDDCDE